MNADLLLQFTPAVLKLREARNQRAVFRRKWLEHVQSAPWRFDLKRSDPQSYALIGRQRRPVPLDLAVHLGIWLQQHRHALNSAVHAFLAVKFPESTRPEPIRAGFPITLSQAHFAASPLVQSHLVNGAVLELLEGFQPYRRGYLGPIQNPSESSLFWLEKLAEVDKLRSLHVGVGLIRIPQEGFARVEISRELPHQAQEGVLVRSGALLLSFRSSHSPLVTVEHLHQPMRLFPDVSGWGEVTTGSESWRAGAQSEFGSYRFLSQRMDAMESEITEICTKLAELAGANNKLLAVLKR